MRMIVKVVINNQVSAHPLDTVLHCSVRPEICSAVISSWEFDYINKVQTSNENTNEIYTKKNVHLVELNWKNKDISGIAGKLSKDFSWLCFSYKRNTKF